MRSAWAACVGVALAAGAAASGACGDDEIFGAPDASVDARFDVAADAPRDAPAAADAGPGEDAATPFCKRRPHTLCDDFDDGGDPSQRWTVSVLAGEGGVTDAFAASPPLSFGGAWADGAAPEGGTTGAVAVSRSFGDAGGLTVGCDFLVHDQSDDVDVVRVDGEGLWEVAFGVKADAKRAIVFVRDVDGRNHVDQVFVTTPFALDRWYRVQLVIGASGYQLVVTNAAGSQLGTLNAAVYPPSGELVASFGPRFAAASRGAVYVDDVAVDVP